MLCRGLFCIQKALIKVPRSTLGFIESARKLPMVSYEPLQVRHHSGSNKDSSLKSDKTAELPIDPQLMIAFTCKVCETRSSHTFSKQSYTKGSVLIQCPGCKNRHLIADNLKMFRDEKVNLEDLLRTKGESVASSTNDLAFEDIPESLRSKIGHYAKDAPEGYTIKEPETNYLQSGDSKSDHS